MKRPEDLSKEELEEVVSGIFDAMFVEDGEIDPDKEWNPDTHDEVREILDRFGLSPDS